jgi:hypothetical protein
MEEKQGGAGKARQGKCGEAFHGIHVRKLAGVNPHIKTCPECGQRFRTVVGGAKSKAPFGVFCSDDCKEQAEWSDRVAGGKLKEHT